MLNFSQIVSVSAANVLLFVSVCKLITPHERVKIVAFVVFSQLVVNLEAF